MLPGLTELVGCDLATYNEIGPGPDQVRYAANPADALDPATRRVFAAYVHEHPLINYYRQAGYQGPLRISDLLSRAQFHRLGLYAEFFRPIPVEHQLAFTLSTPGTSMIGVALNRARRDFTDPERDLVGLLRGPLLAGLLRSGARRQANVAVSAVRAGRVDLTDRELQILQFVAVGRTNVAIARRLDVSPRTVAKHLEHAYRKLGVANRAAAIHSLPRVATTGAS